MRQAPVTTVTGTDLAAAPSVPPFRAGPGAQSDVIVTFRSAPHSLG